LLCNEHKAIDKAAAFMTINGIPLVPFIDGGCPTLNLGVEADDTNPVILEKVRKTVVKLTKTLTQVLTDGIDSGEFVPELQAKKFAVKAICLIEGGISYSKIINSNLPMLDIIYSLKKELKSYLTIPLSKLKEDYN
jgi:TetR/AcrR family transcriptional repressor of nem operon